MAPTVHPSAIVLDAGEKNMVCELQRSGKDLNEDRATGYSCVSSMARTAEGLRSRRYPSLSLDARVVRLIRSRNGGSLAGKVDAES